VSQFVDEAQVNVRGGDGGAGSMSFRREAHVPRGGPDGGDGGKGGDVILRADRNVASLLAFRDHPHRRAASATHGAGKRRTGAAGDDLVVAVPEGTRVKTRDGAVVADLVSHGDSYVAASGGRYKLSAFIGKLDQPTMGFSMTVKMEVSYTLVDTQSGMTVWTKNIPSTYTAKASEAFAGTTRLRLANEGAAKDNIQQAITEISAVEL